MIIKSGIITARNCTISVTLSFTTSTGNGAPLVTGDAREACHVTTSAFTLATGIVASLVTGDAREA
jgi:hypothetical protein